MRLYTLADYKELSIYILLSLTGLLHTPGSMGGIFGKLGFNLKTEIDAIINLQTKDHNLVMLSGMGP